MLITFTRKNLFMTIISVRRHTTTTKEWSTLTERSDEQRAGVQMPRVVRARVGDIERANQLQGPLIEAGEILHLPA